MIEMWLVLSIIPCTLSLQSLTLECCMSCMFVLLHQRRFSLAVNRAHIALTESRAGWHKPEGPGSAELYGREPVEHLGNVIVTATMIMCAQIQSFQSVIFSTGCEQHPGMFPDVCGRSQSSKPPLRGPQRHAVSCLNHHKP